MSAVLAFPGRLDAPVTQQPRRGRLPKAIGSLRQKRAEIAAAVAQKEQERRQYMRSVRLALMEALERVEREMLVGFVIVGRASDGRQVTWRAGTCADSYGVCAGLLAGALPLMQEWAEWEAYNGGDSS